MPKKIISVQRTYVPSCMSEQRALRLVLGWLPDPVNEVHRWTPDDRPTPAQITILRSLGVTVIPGTWTEAQHVILRLRSNDQNHGAGKADDPNPAC